MFVIRAIVGFAFLAIAIAAVPVWFDQPVAVLVTMIFTVLGLWVMGWVSRFASNKTLEEHASKEEDIRQSKYFCLRNRIIGVIALSLGASVLVLAYQSNWQTEWKPLAGGVIFVLMGAWYLFKGCKAE